MNFIKTIIGKIKLKDKDLEGTYVAIDDLGNIIGFDKDVNIVEDIAGLYNEKNFENKKKIIQLKDIQIREKIKKYL